MAYETWNNNDTPQTPGGFGRPEWPYERQVRTVAQLVTSNLTITGATTIKFTLPAAVSTVGLAAGQYVNLLSGSAVANLSSNGSPGMFVSNNTVASVSANLVVLTTGVTGNIAAGSVIGFDALIVRPTGEVSATYYADTVLATDSRITAANNKIGGSVNTGWVHVRKKTNGLTGEVRYIRETLVCLTDTSSVNTAGGNTSWGRAFANT
jgi:hypothetical protein